MSNVNVDVEAIVRNIGKNIEFMQPVYEAIINSLEANADTILVEFFKEEQVSMQEIEPKVTSFTITDNGEGFTFENRESFKKLLTTHKITKGCKGSGRFTWLNVFKDIVIDSQIKETKEHVTIPFSITYGNSDIKVKENESNIDKTLTTINFKNVTDKMYNKFSDGRLRVDKREIANINIIYEKILNYLLIKLFLIKKENKDFKIIIKLGSETKTITPTVIPDIDCKEFFIKPVLNVDKIKFELYYYFVSDNKKSKKVHYCAHERVVETISDELGFSASLPNNDSFTMLLCSTYFDENVGDSRNGLDGLKGLKGESIDRPLLLSTITFEMKKVINDIILNKYPNLLTLNEEIKQKAINREPYLAKYINNNEDILVSELSLIKEAKKTFNESKTAIHNKFIALLKNAEINETEFNKSINDMSEIALAELGEYINYRKAIIDALDKSLSDTTKKEEFLHNIFMPKGKTSKAIDDYTLNNLWLLDDKFMTYSYAASDVTINKIISEIEEKDKKTFLDAKKPDMTIFYNKETNKDLVVVEFKGLNASLGEKEKSITEVTRNSLIIKKNIADINTTWSYIITSIDNEFEVSLISSEFKPLFSNETDSKIYYRYYPTINTHVYAIDIKALISDSYSRNKTFLNILKKQN